MCLKKVVAFPLFPNHSVFARLRSSVHHRSRSRIASDQRSQLITHTSIARHPEEITVSDGHSMAIADFGLSNRYPIALRGFTQTLTISGTLGGANLCSGCWEELCSPYMGAKPRPTLDKNLASMGPGILSSIGVGVWRRVLEAFPNSNTTLNTYLSSIFCFRGRKLPQGLHDRSNFKSQRLCQRA